MKRETGYYWCKLKLVKHWYICYFDEDGKWYHGFTERHPIEIDEHQIIHDYVSSDPNYKLTIIDGSKVLELKNLTNPK